eukprot:TRINITY_DN30036_c0_g1_i2.p1 TRINITY_DN30036_c0_g1~~TRINITY_DN30036_c0_g1_i2.p1  ORF type:complete len:603 (+),score=218.50 TRINITY_DN30036_c0_g1_i2:182-1990(+)
MYAAERYQLQEYESEFLEKEREIRDLHSELAAWGGAAGRRQLQLELNESRDALRGARDELSEFKNVKKRKELGLDPAGDDGNWVGWTSLARSGGGGGVGEDRLLQQINRQAESLNRAHAKAADLTAQLNNKDNEVLGAAQIIEELRTRIEELRADLVLVTGAKNGEEEDERRKYQDKEKRLLSETQRQQSELQRLRAAAERDGSRDMGAKAEIQYLQDQVSDRDKEIAELKASSMQVHAGIDAIVGYGAKNRSIIERLQEIKMFVKEKDAQLEDHRNKMEALTADANAALKEAAVIKDKELKMATKRIEELQTQLSESTEKNKTVDVLQAEMQKKDEELLRMRATFERTSLDAERRHRALCSYDSDTVHLTKEVERKDRELKSNTAKFARALKELEFFRVKSKEVDSEAEKLREELQELRAQRMEEHDDTSTELRRLRSQIEELTAFKREHEQEIEKFSRSKKNVEHLRNENARLSASDLGLQNESARKDLQRAQTELDSLGEIVEEQRLELVKLREELATKNEDLRSALGGLAWLEAEIERQGNELKRDGELLAQLYAAMNAKDQELHKAELEIARLRMQSKLARPPPPEQPGSPNAPRSP